MTKDIFNYVVFSGAQSWFFEDFRSATDFVNRCVDQTTYPRIYKLVYANGELVKDGKR